MVKMTVPKNMIKKKPQRACQSQPTRVRMDTTVVHNNNIAAAILIAAITNFYKSKLNNATAVVVDVGGRGRCHGTLQSDTTGRGGVCH